MSNESTKNCSPSFSPPRPPPPPSSSSVSSSSSIDSYIGSFISLTSKFEIRYEGVLHYLNPHDSTLALTNVRSYGTEGRKKDGPQIPPSDRVYEYIMFRGSDIKDLQVKSLPPAQKEELIQNDPAIIQSHSLLSPSSSSKPVPADGGNLTKVSSYQEPSVLTKVGSYQESLYQSGNPMAPPQATQNGNVASLTQPTYWPGYSGMSSNIPYASQHANPLLPVSATTPSLPVANQNLLQPSATSPSINLGLTYPPKNDSNYVHLSNIPSLCPEQRPNSSSVPSLLSVKPSLPSHPAFLTANRLTASPFPSPRKDLSAIEAPIIEKAGSDSLPGISFQSSPYSASSAADSRLGSLLEGPPALLTPNQLAQPRPPLLPSTQNPYLDRKDAVPMNSTPNLSSSIATPVVQAPLLPLPRTAQQFTEEFDFEAMNEKFKKEEVWGYLGGAKQRSKAEGMEDIAVGQNLGHEGSYSSAPSLDPNPAYKKDDFFDTISCNSVARGPRTEQNRFSDRMKHNTATFGNIHQRPHLGYGGHGAAGGTGENFRDSYNNWERRYNYGGRGRGGNWRI